MPKLNLFSRISTAVFAAFLFSATLSPANAQDVLIEKFVDVLEDSGVAPNDAEQIKNLLNAAKDIAVQYMVNSPKPVSSQSPIGPVAALLNGSADIAKASLIITANIQIKRLVEIGSQRNLTAEEGRALMVLTQLIARLSNMDLDDIPDPTAEPQIGCIPTPEGGFEALPEVPVYIRRENETVGDMVCRVKCASAYLRWDESRRVLRNTEIESGRLLAVFEAVDLRRLEIAARLSESRQIIETTNIALDKHHITLQNLTDQAARLALTDVIVDLNNIVAFETDNLQRQATILREVQAEWNIVNANRQSADASLSTAKNAERAAVSTYQNCIRNCVSAGRAADETFLVLARFLRSIGTTNNQLTDEQMLSTRDMMRQSRTAGNACEKPSAEPVIVFSGQILAANYPQTIVSDGDSGSVALLVAGQFTFPVTTILRPKSCPGGTTCNIVSTIVFAFDGKNRLISADVLWCTGVSDNWNMDYEVFFQDTAGNRSNAVNVSVLCRGI